MSQRKRKRNESVDRQSEVRNHEFRTFDDFVQGRREALVKWTESRRDRRRSNPSDSPEAQRRRD